MTCALVSSCDAISSIFHTQKEKGKSFLITFPTYSLERNKIAVSSWTAVVAEWVEWSPPTPSIRGSNPAIGKIHKCPLAVLKR